MQNEVYQLLKFLISKKLLEGLDGKNLSLLVSYQSVLREEVVILTLRYTPTIARTSVVHIKTRKVGLITEKSLQKGHVMIIK